MQSRIDVAGCSALIDKCQVILGSLEIGQARVVSSLKPEVSRDDHRIACVQYLTVVVHNLKVSIILMRDALLHFRWWDQHGYNGLTNEQKMENASRYWEGAVFGSFHGMHSVLENAIRALFLAFNSAAYGESLGQYWKVRKRLNDDYVQIPADFRDFFFLTSILRNCIHNGGVYRNKDKPIETANYKGKSFEFRDGLPPNCLNPPFFMDLLQTAADGLVALMCDPKVLQLSKVEDAYIRIGEYETSI